MRSIVGIVCLKEVLETARDRRTLFSLLLGPLIGPLIFVVMINVVVSRNVSFVEQPLDVPIVGDELAPNFVAFLRSRGIREPDDHGVVDLTSAAAAIRAGTHDVVLVIDEHFAEDFGTAEPARVTFVFDQSSSRAGSRVGRLRSAVNGYVQQVASLRLVANGVDPTLLRPVIVDEYDVSTPAGRSVLMLGMLTYFLLFATLIGGLHLAIDTTAGERERKSLEPLLTTPVSRAALLAGKMAATCCYMIASLALTLAAFVVALRHLPLEQLGMSTTFGVATALAVFLVLLPFVPLGAAVMTVIASFTKTYREAQTYLSFAILVPTFPVIFAAILDVSPSPRLMWIPSMSQHLLITSYLKQEPLGLGLALLSAASSLAIGAAVAWLAVRLYRREAILG